jgi:hypothetical protein
MGMIQGLEVIYRRLLERQQAVDDDIGRPQRMVETAGALLQAFRGRGESHFLFLLIEVAVFIGFNQNSRYRYFLNGLLVHDREVLVIIMLKDL